MTIQTQVDELLAQMTPAEKAGQLTQYFYFRLPEGAAPALDFRCGGRGRTARPRGAATAPSLTR